MGITDRNGPNEATDDAFERMLLDSARIDGPSSAAAREAWARFAGATGAVATVIAGAGAARGAALRTARIAGLKWLAIGAIGGSALTATWFGARRSSSVLVAPPSLGAIASSSGAIQGESAAAMPPATPVVTPTLSETARRPRAILRKTPARSPNADATMLAAEVAALDAVSAAISARNAHEALLLVETYHRDFPEGQLAAEAEMLALEALETQGERAELARRAEGFLVRYPNDPHAPRVRSLSNR